jgi:DNA-binding GntR family transcriptional regulator
MPVVKKLDADRCDAPARRRATPMGAGQGRSRPAEPATRGTPSPRSFKADQVYAALKEAILSGRLEPGMAIDKLALGERLGMSRFPITTAINRLAFERMVVIEPQHGSFVTRIAAEDVRELMLIRRALEAEIAAAAAAELDDVTLDAIDRNLLRQAEAAEAADSAGFYALDVEFHRSIALGAHLRHAVDILDGIRSQLERIRRLLLTPPGRLPGTLDHHRAIAAALRVRDTGLARAAMHAHLVQTTALFEAFAQERPALFSA